MNDYSQAQHIYFIKRKKKAEKMMYWHLNFLKEYTEYHLLTVQIDNESKFEDYCLKKFL